MGVSVFAVKPRPSNVPSPKRVKEVPSHFVLVPEEEVKFVRFVLVRPERVLVTLFLGKFVRSL